MQRFLSVDPLAVDFAAWSPYNYVLGNPIIFVDPDGRAPENIIIGTTDGHSTDNPGHVAVAIEQYDESGNKTGNVIVFETSLPVRIRDQIKKENEGGGALQKYQALYEKHQAEYGGVPMSMEDFEKREFDAKFEFETTREEDQTSTANLTRAQTNGVPYVIAGNNCANYACSAIPKRFGKNIGVETVTSGIISVDLATPNQTAKDLTKLANNNSSVSAKQPHNNVSNLPTAQEMVPKED